MRIRIARKEHCDDVLECYNGYYRVDDKGRLIVFTQEGLSIGEMNGYLKGDWLSITDLDHRIRMPGNE